jgi:hypothetical protein
MKKKIGLMEVKQALRDGRFRDKLPIEIRPDVAKFLQNPGCPCNKPTFKKVLKIAAKELLEYYGDEAEINLEEVAESENVAEMPKGLFAKENNHPPFMNFEFNYTVINCHIDELAKQLSNLAKDTPKQISVARYEDQVTCIVNEIPSRRS